GRFGRDNIVRCRVHRSLFRDTSLFVRRGGDRFEIDRHGRIAGFLATGRGFRIHGGLLAMMCTALNVDREAGKEKTLAANYSGRTGPSSKASMLSSSGAAAIVTFAAKCGGTASATLSLMQTSRIAVKR